MTEEQSIWEQPDRVEEFAKREPDARLLSLVETIDGVNDTCVLDIGCAAGRNAVVLAERGFDIHAIDTSSAMVAKTRERVAAVLGEEEAAARVFVGDMADLSAFTTGSVDLVVALGVYHNARNRDQWDRALEETARVLSAGGRVLVSNFSPRSDPDGSGMQPVEGEPNVYIGFGSERLFLLEAEDLDAEMARVGLEPVEPTNTVIRQTESGRRVTVNALYEKGPDDANRSPSV
jgi:SAM-dependent methyltransferase